MAQQFQLPDGRIVEALPQGGYKVISGGNPVNNPFVDPKLSGALQGQQLNNQGQALQNVHTQQQIAQTPLLNEHTKAEIAQAQTQVKNTGFDNVNNLRNQFEKEPSVQDYKTILPLMDSAMRAKDNKAGDLNIVYAFGKAMDPNSVVREGEQVMATNVGGVSEKVKGYIDQINGQGQLTPAQRTALIEEIRSRARAISDTYNQRRAFYEDFAKRNGINPLDVVGPHPGAPFKSDEIAYIEEHGGTSAPHQQELATGKMRNEYDPQLSGQIDALIRKGAPLSQAAALARQAGYSPPDPGEYAKAVAYAKQNPGYKNSLAEATRQVPTTGWQRFAASPAGSFISGAGKAATLGFGDELAASVMPGDYATNRDAFAAKQSILAGQNPTADLLGQIAGGALAGYGTANLASKLPGAAAGMFGARTPLPGLLSREAVAGDALYGGGYGAGSNNDNRLQGGLEGVGLGIGGGIAARGAVNGIASAISPTGGKLAPLYQMGVRPSIGQRVGGVVDSAEERLQSIPVVGDAIAGTRNRARDQFQIGLFNDALGEIGQKLPDGMDVGHEPHAFTQKAFNTAYDAARSNMRAVPDAQFGQDIGALQQKVSALRPESQSQFNKIWTGSVGRRFQNAGGALAGNDYKSAISEIEQRAAAIRKNQTGDAELADALDHAAGAIEASAMRNSPPEAVAAMTAADRGYAKLVRLEQASRSAGGEPAEFSPSQYNNAVRNASGGVRNRDYLAGKALNSDIAALGTKLGDKVANSRTVDRLLPVLALGGASYVEPMTAAAMGGIGVLNAPGIRNLTTGLMAPRNNPLFDRAAEQLRQRARLAGMFGAPAALDYYLGQ